MFVPSFIRAVRIVRIAAFIRSIFFVLSAAMRASFPHCGKAAAIPLLLAATIFLSACGGGQLAPTRITAVPPYSACLKYCAGLEDENAFVRDGCRRGCELALASFDIRGGHYVSMENCRENVRELDVALAQSRLGERCDETWEGQDRRDGCRAAGDAFYEAVTENLCRSDMP